MNTCSHQRWLSLFALIAFVLLSGCDDPRNRTEGTVESLATYTVTDDAIKQAQLELGGTYSHLASARSPAEFDVACQLLSSEELGTVSSIRSQLINCIAVIEKQPSTQAARLADILIQQNQGFLAGSPEPLQRWRNARQRMSTH
jgi:hypothetical protein